MQDINPQGSPTLFFQQRHPAMEAARQNLINAFADVPPLDRGVHKDVAVLFQADPLSADDRAQR